MTTVRDLLAEARGRLAAAGLDAHDAAVDADVLVREAFGWDRARLLAHTGDEATADVTARVEALVRRRAAREPVSQILGRREFWGLEFQVTRDVLTPRPETELVVEEALACVRDHDGAPLELADVGTGSGCLAVALACELPHARVLATDVSAAALALARANAARHGVADRIRCEQASLLGRAAGLALIVSNPPYIPTGDLAGLPPEVRAHEPAAALDGGPDGLDVIRGLLAAGRPALLPGGWLVFEFGDGQEDLVRAAIRESSLELVRIRADLQGIPRTAVTRRG